jgi:hypothetical protein
LEAEFNQLTHYYCDLERKYSGAEQLIVKLQKECQTLQARSGRQASMIKSIQFEEDRLGIEPEILAELARIGVRI